GDPENVSLGHWGEVNGFQFGAALLRRQCWSGEDANTHRRPNNRRARRPNAKYFTSIKALSKPGTTTRTTGRPNSGLVRSTTTTREMPTARNRSSFQAMSSSKVSASYSGVSRNLRKGPGAASHSNC